LTQHLEPLRADPSHSAVLLDIDGVLAPIVRHADDAHVPEPTRIALIAVARRYGLVACVTGRRATTARRIVSLGTITYVGNHGAEHPLITPDPRHSRALDPLRERLRSHAGQIADSGVSVEDKGLSIALHYRCAPVLGRALAALGHRLKRGLDFVGLHRTSVQHLHIMKEENVYDQRGYRRNRRNLSRTYPGISEISGALPNSGACGYYP
jgi:trehalose-phosphatase